MISPPAVICLLSKLVLKPPSLFLSHLAVCVMFICSYTVSALLPDSRAAPKQGAYISREGALLPAQWLNVKGVYVL